MHNALIVSFTVVHAVQHALVEGVAEDTMWEIST